MKQNDDEMQNGICLFIRWKKCSWENVGCNIYKTGMYNKNLRVAWFKLAIYLFVTK
jgi:hypothetical protein